MPNEISQSSKSNAYATFAQVLANQNKEIAELIKTSQIWMAKKTVELQIALNCKLWLVGYAEVKEKRILVKFFMY